MEQLYGARWPQSFGNDPLGRYKNAEGERNPRMEQWIEALAPVSWDRLRAVVTQIRKHPRPYDGWLPDLQFVTPLVEPRRLDTPVNLRPFAMWVGRLCDARLIRTIHEHGPFTAESLEQLAATTHKAKETFVAMVRSGDMTEEGTREEVEVINQYLDIEYRKLTITKLTPEAEQEALVRWQQARGLLQTPQRD